MAVIDSAALELRANRYSGAGNWLDESGNGHHAVPTGSPTWDGEKFTLSGSGQYFTVPDAADLDPGAGDFTVVVVATPAAGAGQDLISKRTAGVPWWDLETNANTGVVAAGVSDGPDFVFAILNGVIAAGTRSTISMRIIRSTDRIRISVDETHTEEDIATIGTVDSSTDLVIGGTFNPDFAGDIYGVAVFGTSLSDAEVAQVGVELIASPSQNRMGGTGAIRKPPR